MSKAEQLLDLLLRVPLFEMASLRTEVRNKIESYSIMLLSHLVLVEIFSAKKSSKLALNLDHWQTEIQTFKGSIRRANKKLGKSKFSQSELYDILTDDDNDDTCNDVYYNLKVKYDITIDEVTSVMPDALWRLKDILVGV